MARKRMIDPGIWTDEGFIELTSNSRLLFIGIISNADDEGRGLGSAKSLKAQVFPADELMVPAVEQMKTELARHLHVVFYKVGGVEYYQLDKWYDYQSIDHSRPSAFPGPDCADAELEELQESKSQSFVERSSNGSRTIIERSTKKRAGSRGSSRQLINELTNKSINPLRERSANFPTAGPVHGGPAVKSAGEAVRKMFNGIRIEEK